MAFTIEDFEDLHRLLEQRPDWRARLRQLLIGEDLDRINQFEADIIARGLRRSDRTSVYLLVEISWDVGPTDVERASRRAALVARLGTPVVAAGAGHWIAPGAASDAQRLGVWVVTNGRATSPVA